ncbi:MAG: hypothetical protein RJA87_1759 [Pseudomonadota bacterium]|jgi:hypothetical protein
MCDLNWMKIAAVSGLVCLAPLAAKAQDVPGRPAQKVELTQPAAVADLAQGRKVALFNRYMTAIHADQMMLAMTRSMISAMVEDMRRRQPQLSDADAKLISDTVEETMQELMPTIISETSKVTVDVFSEDDLLQIATFYEGPIGQRLVEQSPAIMAKTGEIMRTIMPLVQTRITEKICQKRNCTGQPAKRTGG